MNHTQPASRITTMVRRTAIILVIALPLRLSAQSADRVIADTPSQSSATRMQHDSLTVHFLRTPKGKPAALSVGGKTASQSRKFSGKPDPVATEPAVSTPMPTRARSTKP